MKIVKKIEGFIENTITSICVYPISITITMLIYMSFQSNLVHSKMLYLYIGQLVLMFDKSGFEIAIREYMKGHVQKQKCPIPIISTIYLSTAIYFWIVTGQRLLLILTIEQLIWSYLLFITYNAIKNKINEEKKKD